MTNNCLVTKLKAVVNNDNLPFFDSVIIYVPKGTDVLTRVASNVANTCVAKYLNSDTTSKIKTFGAATYGDSCYLPLDPGNQSSYWGIATTGSDNNRLVVINHKFNITFLVNFARQNLDVLSECTRLRTLSFQTGSSLPDYIVKGDIVSLIKLINLRTLDLRSGNVYGTLESLVEGLISNSIADSTIQYHHSGKTTFNNVTPNPVRLYKLIFADGGCSVYEDASTAQSGQDTLVGSYDGSAWTYI